MSFDTPFESGDRAATGDVNGDGVEELLIGNTEGGRVDVFEFATREPLAGFGIGDTTLDNDGGNGFAVGDVDDDGRVEVFVANRSGGRIDVLDPATGQPKPGFGIGDTTFNNGDSPEMAVGDVDGDGRVEVFVANSDFGGRVDVLDPDTGQPKPGFGIGDTTMNNTGDNQFKVADVDGDSRVEALVANADENGRIDIFDPDTGVPKPGLGVVETGFDTDDVFAVSNFGNGDLDGDGIPDRVELRGIRDANGNVVLDFAELGASPCRKDIIVEIDYMVDDSGDSDDHSHEPVESDVNGDGILEYPALDDVRAAFNSGRPVDGVDDCPYPGKDNGDGINLINIVDDAIADEQVIDVEAVASGKSDVDRLKDAHFDPALDLYVHWSLWMHDYQETDSNGVVGVVDAGGVASPSKTAFADDQDFLVTNRGGTRGLGDVLQQSLTYMHELGHTIGLRHGGGEHVNCKPNYLSVMNYTFARTGLSTADLSTTGFLDFSRQELTPVLGLDEDNLVEADGVGGPALLTMWADATGTTETGDASGPLDWSGGDDDANGVTDDDIGVDADINSGLRNSSGNTIDCSPNNSSGAPLTGFNDWAALNESLAPVPFSGSLGEGQREPTSTEMATLQALWDQALFPDTSVQLRPPRTGFQGNVVGVAVDDEHVYATHGYRSTSTPPASTIPGTLLVLDRQTMQIESRIPVGFGPNAVAVNPNTNRAYVVNRGVGSLSLSVIDTISRQVVADIPLGQVPIDVAVNTRLNRVYVSNPFAQRIEVIDGATNTKLTPIDIGPAHGLAVDETTGTVYTALTRRPGGVLPPINALGAVVDNGIDPPQVLASVALTGVFESVDVAVDPIGDRLYVATHGNPVDKPGVVVLERSSRTQLGVARTRGPARARRGHARHLRVRRRRRPRHRRHRRHRADNRADNGPRQCFRLAVSTGADRQIYTGDFTTGQLHRLSPTSGQAT